MTFGDAPMVHLTAAVSALEQQTGIRSVSIVQVHPSYDLPGMESGAIVVTDGDPERATREAETLARYFWERRHDFEPTLLSVADAVEQGRRIDGLVLLVDAADCVGGGAAGDGSHPANQATPKEVCWVV